MTKFMVQVFDGFVTTGIKAAAFLLLRYAFDFLTLRFYGLVTVYQKIR